eukprot:CAMPEP_0206594040 /NCGR_PEP_ID=MMETSP0325_2-20121206/42096_1 /ASSEMBLY_ACC=CAM_ASM_000347 /TAXON_ID=2866 /ORGANISM="Crypthecodinium cohnii, Strain Seligo" /LENGTH=71 /DNA_ID=CAMNT_0054104343 /DNA_START=245 /DNA_END=461 /DNA_ORIENTATION=+
MVPFQEHAWLRSWELAGSTPGAEQEARAARAGGAMTFVGMLTAEAEAGGGAASDGALDGASVSGSGSGKGG